MEKIKSQKHSKETFYYALSRILERASYYGFRALVVLYMTGETLKMDAKEAIRIYGWFISLLIFSQIVGALLGDLLIGNKKAVIIGGLTQAIGVFCLCIPFTNGLYLGLFFVVLGGGFFMPNIISNFGKLYLNKTKLLDAGFTIFYLAVNLGSFLGILLIGYLGETFGYTIGFIIAGMLMLLSIIPILISKEKIENKFDKNELSISKRVLKISITFLIVGVFWSIYEISNNRFYDLQLQLSEISTLDIPKYLWQSISTIFIFPISIIVIILWTFFYNSQTFKLMFGFIFGVLSFGVLFLIPEESTEQNTITYFVSLFFLGIAEIYIAPIIYTTLTKYSNPKYLAILISLAFLPTKLIFLIFGLFNGRFYDNPIFGLKFGIITMSVIGIGLFGYVWWSEKRKKPI